MKKQRVVWTIDFTHYKLGGIAAVASLAAFEAGIKTIVSRPNFKDLKPKVTRLGLKLECEFYGDDQDVKQFTDGVANKAVIKTYNAVGVKTTLVRVD